MSATDHSEAPLAPPGAAPVMAPNEPLPSLERELSRLGVHCVSVGSTRPGTALRRYVDTGRGHLRLFRWMNWIGVPPSPFRNKALTKQLLDSAGFATPFGKRFRAGQFKEAMAWYRKSGLKRVVVKPNGRRRGNGIGSDIGSAEELEFYLGRLPSTAFLIEEHVDGDDHRLLCVGGRVVAATRRVPAHVVGDGASTIAELVALKNAARQHNPVGRKFPLVIDALTMHLLTRAGLTPDSAPDAGQTVWLRTASNVGAGGEHEEVTDRVHDCFVDLAERIAQTVARPYSVVGIDILCHDITSDSSLAGARVTEIEDDAGLFGHSYPLFGEGPPRNAIRRIAEHVLRRYDIVPEFRRRTYLITGEGLEGYAAWLQGVLDDAGMSGHVRQINAETVECDLTGGRAVLDNLMRQAVQAPGDGIVQAIACVSDQPALPGSFPTLPERCR